jgi:hypothetical protein
MTTRSTSGESPRIVQSAQPDHKTGMGENRCVSETRASNDHRIAGAAPDPGASPDPQTGQPLNQYDGRLAQCGAGAKGGGEGLSAGARLDYQDAAQSERDRNSLITILTTSRPH